MRRLAALLALLTVAACVPESATDASEELAGDYFLQTVNGKPLPFSPSTQPNQTIYTTSWRISISPRGSWYEKIDFRWERTNFAPSFTSQEATGTWRFSADSASVILDDAEYRNFRTGTISGSTFTIVTADGLGSTITWVYQR
jgi:hypothetical protein